MIKKHKALRMKREGKDLKNIEEEDDKEEDI